MMVWPVAIQTIFRDASFVGNETALIRILGMTVTVIGWLYLFGSLSGDRRTPAADPGNASGDSVLNSGWQSEHAVVYI